MHLRKNNVVRTRIYVVIMRYSAVRLRFFPNKFACPKYITVDCAPIVPKIISGLKTDCT